jgi:hypothetical protein
MKNFTILTALPLLAASAFAAEPVAWAPTSADDLRIDSLPSSAPAVPPSRHAETDPVHFAWPLTIDRAESAPAGPAMESRQYWVDTNGLGLEKGLKLPLSSAGAIVRVSALTEGSGTLLDAELLQVEVDGQSLPVTQGAGGLELFSGSDLQAQGLAVPSDSLAFQLPKQGQASAVQLQLAGVPADQPLVVHVFEPESPWIGRLAAERHNLLAGEEFKLDVSLGRDDERFAAQSIQAVLVSPDAAQAWPLEVSDGGFALTGIAPASCRMPVKACTKCMPISMVATAIPRFAATSRWRWESRRPPPACPKVSMPVATMDCRLPSMWRWPPPAATRSAARSGARPGTARSSRWPWPRRRPCSKPARASYSSTYRPTWCSTPG